MIRTPPPILLLEAIKLTLIDVDYEFAANIPGVTIRHARNRNAVRAERPALSIIWTGDDPRPGDELFRNAWETVREFSFDLQTDVDLPSDTEGLDDTGWLYLTSMLAAAMEALCDPESPLRKLCDDVVPGSLDPDEKSDADNGRLVRSATVLYRVRTDDQNVLLAAGVDA